MTIIDAGPLVAILDRDDKYHRVCVALLGAMELPLVTTLPALTEAMYFLGRRYGWRGQERLWDLLDSGQLEMQGPSALSLAQMRTLTRKYRDAPMDFADASLVALAEALGLDFVFTLDSHFRAYGLSSRRVLRIPPEAGG